MAGETGTRVAIVLGGAGGIGSAICRRLAADGYRLGIGDVAAEGAAALAAALEADGGAGQRGDGPLALARAVDATDGAATTALVEATLAAYGRLDGLVYCVGISPRHEGRAPRLEEIDRAAWDRVLATNLSGAFLAAQAAAPALIRQGGGSIVTISSGQGRVPAGNNSSGCHYVASKAGLIGLSKALAGELAPHGVRVNSVAPGWVATPLTADQRPEIVAALRAAVPLGRTARPEDIAGAVAFLLSDDAAFITGATLDVNGGRIML
jgi:3-oxoacyl-[acyl-carrier protein] reductase